MDWIITSGILDYAPLVILVIIGIIVLRYATTEGRGAVGTLLAIILALLLFAAAGFMFYRMISTP